MRYCIFLLVVFAFLFTSAARAQPDSTLLKIWNPVAFALSDTALYRLAFKAGQNRVFSEPDSARAYFDRAAKAAARLNDDLKKGLLANQFGRVFYVKGLYAEALQSWSKADSIYLKNNYVEGRGTTLSNIGLIYAAWEENELALRYYRQALKYAQVHPDSLQILNASYNIGITHKTLGQQDSALRYFDFIKKEAVKPAYRLQKARAYMMSGESLLEKNQPEEAHKNALQAAKLLVKTDSWDRGFLMGVLARTHLALNQPDSAIVAANEGIELQLQINAKWELARLYAILSAAHEKQGSKALALDHLKRHLAYKDSVFTDHEKRDLFRRELARKELETARLALENQDKEDQLLLQRIILLGTILLIAGGFVVLVFLDRANRTKQELNTRLAESNAELTRLNHFKIELLSIVGHDMANMMTSLSGFLELFSARRLNQADLEIIGPMLEENLMRLHLTFNNLFRWAESQLDGFHQQKETISTSEIFADQLRIFQPVAESRSILLQTQIENAETVHFDPNHLQLVLRNLVHNALKFTPNGGIVILYAQKSGSKIRLGVRDTGSGIDTEMQHRILETSQRLSKMSSRKESGTGLGLQTSKKLLLLNGSALQIQSDGKSGSDFFFDV